MPYAALVLNDNAQQIIFNAAARMRSSSAFTPAADHAVPSHVPLHGGLHVYSQPQVCNALAAAADMLPVTGRFVRWEAARGQGGRWVLRLLVELVGSDLRERLKSLLPRGRAWKQLSVAVGSLEAIPSAQHAEFVAAVNTTWPLTSESRFSCDTLRYVDSEAPHTGAQPMSKRSVVGTPRVIKLATRSTYAKTAATNAPTRTPLDPVCRPSLDDLLTEHIRSRNRSTGAIRKQRPRRRSSGAIKSISGALDQFAM